MGGIAFAVFAAIYYWFPLYAGRWYQRTLAKWRFWLSMVGTQLTFFPMILLGYSGMPRRYASYDLPIGPTAYFADLHQPATLGAFVLALGQIVFVRNIVQSWLEGPPIEDGDPWDLEKYDHQTHEWRWFDRRLETALADGGEEHEDSDRYLATSGGDHEN